MNNQPSITNRAVCPSTAAKIALPTLPKEGEIRLGSDEVRAFFPLDLSGVLQLPSEDIRFFGTLHIEGGESGGVRASYFLAPYLLRSALPAELSRLSLWNTDDDRIRGTAATYHEEITKKYPELTDTVPMVVLRIRSNWLQEEQNPFKIMEFHRYADHRQFRGRGLASSILKSVCEQLRSRGTEYLYINFPAEKWPESSSVIPNQFASAELRQKIDGCFSPASGYKGFSNDFSWSGFIVITDPTQHILEFQKADINRRKLQY